MYTWNDQFVTEPGSSGSLTWIQIGALVGTSVAPLYGLVVTVTGPTRLGPGPVVKVEVHGATELPAGSSTPEMLRVSCVLSGSVPCGTIVTLALPAANVRDESTMVAPALLNLTVAALTVSGSTGLLKAHHDLCVVADVERAVWRRHRIDRRHHRVRRRPGRKGRRKGGRLRVPGSVLDARGRRQGVGRAGGQADGIARAVHGPRENDGAGVASRLKARGTVVPALSFFSVTLVAATVAAARASLYFTASTTLSGTPEVPGAGL